MGGLPHTAQSHESNKPSLILHFKKTRTQPLLYPQLGFYKHVHSLRVRFFKEKLILLSLLFALFCLHAVAPFAPVSHFYMGWEELHHDLHPPGLFVHQK